MLGNYAIPSKIILSPKKRFVYKKSGIVSIDSLTGLLNFVQGVINCGFANILPVDIVFDRVIFQDKLTYILIECILFYLSKEIASPIRFFAKYKPDINTRNIEDSPLFFLKGKDNYDFSKKFNLQLDRNHFRQIIKLENNLDKSCCSMVMQNIDSFLKIYNIEKTYREDISEVVAELIDNALDHGKTDCLLDLGIADGYRKRSLVNGKKVVSDALYYGVNIAIVNFSDSLIGDGLQGRIERSDYVDLPRYQTVTQAKKIHSQKWSDEYTEKDFYILSSFQYKISGRSSSGKTGGTGLTKLLKSLEEKSEDYRCYVLSGNRILNFEHDLLGFDEDKWVGFNIERDYVNNIPDRQCFNKSKFYMPGTAYNLTFVLRREESQ